MKKILTLSSGFLLLIAALLFGFTGEYLIASGCSLAATLIFWFPRFSPEAKTGAANAADIPTPQEVKQYRLDNPGTTIHQAVLNLKERK
ncbi:hypothetical protein [Corynebacterium sp. HS2168-gen11]|uniref:hypothetical protein n=1 Tax=Corynebacterium sp. HS2168-gen11 TaxID=2974027 RepID=UPI00216B128D|nr:hypothetical protein [Corynebacterium sp. HS2168-gen11]MCS4536343.1 hypothetical protein [Corynebacterium sp. HS2168-gen11]